MNKKLEIMEDERIDPETLLKTKQKNWKERVRAKELLRFTNRIQKDLEKIPFPKFEGEIESTFIHGKAETGKTILACQMLLQERYNTYITNTIKDSRSYVYCKLGSFLDELREAFDEKNDKNYYDEMRKIKNCEFLILDDLGTHKQTEWALQVLYMIIDHRYEYLKKTVITSNFNLKELAEFTDERVASRIERMCEVYSKEKDW